MSEKPSPFAAKLTKKQYEAEVAKTRDERMKWFADAKFGMFVHYGPYAVAGLQEWYMMISDSSVEQYEREVTQKFHPQKGCAYEWAKLASEAGCKYMVLTTRHHDGYSMWDSEANPYNVVKYGHDYDVVAEFVDACRKYNMRIGLYHSILDWHNPDCSEGARDFEARIRFIKYHRDMLTELMTRYGKIDMLWYDMCYPFAGENLNFVELNSMVRTLQPDIIINPRSGLDEDLDTPEEHLNPTGKQKYWEACMTFNNMSWGYVDSDEVAGLSYTPQRIIKMLSETATGNGNLLLNIGPTPEGHVPADTVKPLQTVGQWLKVNGAAIYGASSPSDVWVPSGRTVLKGNKLYVIQFITPVLGYLPVNGVGAPAKKVRCLTDGREYEFFQKGTKLDILGVAHGHIDKIAGVTVFEIECENTEPPVKFQRKVPLSMEKTLRENL